MARFFLEGAFDAVGIIACGAAAEVLQFLPFVIRRAKTVSHKLGELYGFFAKIRLIRVKKVLEPNLRFLGIGNPLTLAV